VSFRYVEFSTLLQKHYNKIQETEQCNLKLRGYTYHQGTYTPLWGVRYELALQELQIISLLKRHSRGFMQQ